MKELEKVFKALGQSTRLKIAFLLNEQELCVCELEQILKISQSAISQHMRVLKAADLVNEQRKGQWVFYSLNRGVLTDLLANCLKLLDQGLGASNRMSEEMVRLKQLQKNPIVECRVQNELEEN